MSVPGSEGSRFGTSVALSGDRLAVGAPGAGEQGRVLVFTRVAGTWSPAAELAPSDPSFYAEFGSAVALRGTRLLVGAPHAAPGTGAVYAFEETGSTWVPRQKIVPLAPASGFGTALAIAGVQLTNSGPSAVAGAAIRVSLGAGLALDSWTVASGTCSRAGAVLTCALPSVGVGTTAVAEVLLAAPPGLVLDHVVGCDPADCRIARLGPVSTWLEVFYQVPADYAGPAPIVFSAMVTTASQDPQPANDQDSLSTPFVPGVRPLDFYTLTPCRLYDSRAPGRWPLRPGGARIVSPQSTGCGIQWGARALALNVTVTGATAAGDVRVYPAYSPVPDVSVVNYSPGQTRGANVVIGLSPDGEIAVRASQASGTVHVILDVVGYFE